MKKVFKKPTFNGAQIELRIEDNEVCIYANKMGLEKLSSLCKTLVDNLDIGHIHLEDYEMLTSDSLKGTIAVFKSEK